MALFGTVSPTASQVVVSYFFYQTPFSAPGDGRSQRAVAASRGKLRKVVQRAAGLRDGSSAHGEGGESTASELSRDFGEALES